MASLGGNDSCLIAKILLIQKAGLARKKKKKISRYRQGRSVAKFLSRREGVLEESSDLMSAL